MSADLSLSLSESRSGGVSGAGLEAQTLRATEHGNVVNVM